MGNAALQAPEETGNSMNIKIERASLLKVLSHVQSVVERRGTIPILSNVKLETSEEGLHLTAWQGMHVRQGNRSNDNHERSAGSIAGNDVRCAPVWSANRGTVL